MPAGTPKPIVAKLNGDIVRLLNAPDVRERLLSQGVEIAASSPEQFAQFIKEEIKRWSVAVKQSGAKPE